MEKLEELSLVKRAKKGDIEAFGLLYEQIYRDLYKFALFTLKDASDAEDVVGEAVTDAFETIGKLRSEEAFRGWMFRILANKCRRMLKAYGKRPALREYGEAPYGWEPGEVRETAREDLMDLKKAFDGLEEEDRLIVALAFFGGYSSQEIGKILGKKPGTVRSRQSRALSKMRAFLTGSYGL